MRVERELMRGAGPFAVLKLLKRREMYGYELVEALSAQTEGVLAMGQSTLYPMLYNLEAKGYVAGRWRQAESGRQRKYYALTRKGLQRLASETRQWQALVNAIASLGVTASGAPGAREVAEAQP
jgi:PadR family transcriptional regulator PadR